ncbi:MAG: NADH:flavin oxidoreductase [Alphaproteobacteria bacterium]|nr:NADH:flavin oxidoreductase [Alphaproteobacteria bacterium]
MWRPPERIKWQPDPGPWPTREEAEASRLFQPISVGPIRLAQSTWVPAMVPWRATADGFVTPEAIEWYERLARGRPGAIVCEATGIRDIPSGPLLRIGDDRFIPGLRDLVERVRIASGGETRLFIQLIDFLAIRRRPEPEKFFGRYLAITDRHRRRLGAEDWPEDRIRAHLLALDPDALEDVLDTRELEGLRYGYREHVTDTHLPHIDNLPAVLPDLFAAAARRAREAGFDGVELHYAHAYTMASLLSRLNDRDDRYGGSIENRVRLPLEVFRRVRETVGADFAIGCRFLSEDCVAGGSTVEDSAHHAVEFARAGMDFLSTSRGGRFEDAAQPKVGQAAYPYTGPSGYECMPQFVSDERGPFGRNVEPVTRIRTAVRDAGFATPVVVTGGIHGFLQAEDILTGGHADIVGLARQTLADPDWFLKVRLGRGGEAVVCEYTNYCEALDQKHVPVTCKLWDRTRLDEPGIRMTPDGKRRMTAPLWEPAEDAA